MTKRGRPRRVLPTLRGGEATRKDFAGGSTGKKLGPSGGLLSGQALSASCAYAAAPGADLGKPVGAPQDSFRASHPVESERGCGSGKALVLSGNETDGGLGKVQMQARCASSSDSWQAVSGKHCVKHPADVSDTGR
ncbi:hypothetical protein Dimus_023318 [Dionaea muscipula]